MSNVKAVLLQICLLIGFFVFARGFLPPTRTKLGLSTSQPAVEAQFNRLVFMVVDAMRSDFVFSEQSQMHEIHSLLKNGHGYGFTAYSDPPTVTLPRLKGLTTGASANFLDAVINIAESDTASTLDNQDSWIEQLYARNKTMHMYGDDTWLNLFPSKFSHYDGTASFYVADFTEVDNNVTRHLGRELSSSQWDVLILHYLGLDHIGHKGGPSSPHMPGKQREMSAIASRIYESLDDSTLFVILGDHGMNDVGNHGGASDGETSAAMAFFSKKFDNRVSSPLPVDESYSYYSKIRQVDLVTTLAVLMGIPIPKNSLGVLISDFLPLWSVKDQETLLKTNCRHLELDDCNWLALREQQQYLFRTSSKHILPYMYIGIGILGIVSLICFICCCKIVKTTRCRDLVLAIWWVIVPALYFAGMMGSSTVEEEHYIWFWLLSALLTVLLVCVPPGRYPLLGLFICFRVMRGWNSPGQKWAAMTDAVDVLAAHPNLKLAAVCLTFLFVTSDGFRKPCLKRPLLLCAAVVFMTFKLNAEKHPVSLWWMIWLARFGMACSVGEALLGRYTREALTVFCLMQTKQENIPLWIFIVMSRQALIRLKQIATSEIMQNSLALVGLCFEYVSFFAIGGSNSIASIDLSNAYNGVSGYNIPLVALLTYLGNWGPSLYFSSIVFSTNQKILRVWFYSVALLSVAVACLVLRHHLFIWTVFSPKLLYVGAWLLFHEIFATNIVASFL